MENNAFRYSGREPMPNLGSLKVKAPQEGWLCEVESAIEAGGGRKLAQGPLMRNTNAKDGLAEATYEGCKTLCDVFERSVKEFADSPCLGKRLPLEDGTVTGYKWMTYSEVGEKVIAVASALLHNGICKQDSIGIFGKNAPEWMMAMQACNRMNAKCVPLYDTLGENAVEYIINHAGAKAVFVSAENLPDMIKLKGKIPTVNLIAYWGTADEESASALKDMGVQYFKFTELLDIGSKNPKDKVPASSDDITTLMYTSGTTGDPKGVILTQRNLVSELSAISDTLTAVGVEVGPDDVYLSYLPLAHIFDRVIEELMIARGGAIGFFQGDIKKLLDDIAHLKPTYFVGVPRVFDRIYNAVMNKTKASMIFGFIFNMAFGTKSKRIMKGVSQAIAAPLFDKVVFSKVKARLGGRVRIIISGGAPLSPHVEKFLRTAMCCPVIQGYGLTETCAGSFVAIPDDIDYFGTIGIPLPCIEYRLEDVPEMNYSPASDPPRGEIIVRGPSVFSGYYKDEAQTKGAIDPDGFFHTGDVGEITPSGGLKIIDRKKNIFKLSQGEYVAVEVVEGAYKKNLIVEQIWVYGNSFESSLVAVVIPSEDNLMKWAKENGVDGDFASLCASAEASDYVLSELKNTAKKAKLKGFEVLKAVHLDTEEFSVEKNLITPTFKLKRPMLLKYYDDAVKKMYASLK